jgi:hypothetical protein
MITTIADLVADIERRYTCVKGFPMAISQTNEAYVIINMDGQKEQGARSAFASSEVAAVRGLHGAIIDYIEGVACSKQAEGPLKVFWRVLPEAGEATLYRDDRLAADTDGVFVFTPVKVWQGYARLLATRRPVVYPTMEAYESAHV